jgi:hypothetical protein
MFHAVDADEESGEQPCLDPRIGEMVKNLNLGKEGERLFLEANISFEVLQHLTKDDLQVHLPFRFRFVRLKINNNAL